MQGEWDLSHDEDEDDESEETGGTSPFRHILRSLAGMQTGSRSTRTNGGSVISLSGMSPSDLLHLLSRSRATRVLDDGDEEDDDFNGARRKWFEPVTEPQEAGLELINSGDFGRVANRERVRRNDVNIVRFLSNRSRRPMPSSHKEDYAHDLVPNTSGTAVAACDANIYTGQFSADSSFFYTCSQDFRLHVFDTAAPPEPYVRARFSADAGFQTTMRVMKTIQGHAGRWTITDANLSPDNERIIYSSITPTVYMTSTHDSSTAQTPIPFADPPARSSDRFDQISGYGESFGIWSCRFSADGNEVVAGGSGKIFVYDLLANRRTVKISAHSDDVNSCCWADTTSGNVLVSASDDTFMKVWDRRSLGASQKPSGVLIGHTEGITYVSAKGDGRYVISNGKDQALRLWDLRKMRSNQEFEKVRGHNYSVHNFDYRYPHYPQPKYLAHPQDCSVMTYRGHSVMRTLIRCHFSPMETTGAQYLYSGSADGKIHIWSLDGRVVQVLDRSKTLSMSCDPLEAEPTPIRNRARVCVRDVSWHSQEPVLMSSGWESGRSGSIVARHEWKGLSRLHGNLEDWVERQRQEDEEMQSPRRAIQVRAGYARG